MKQAHSYKRNLGLVSIIFSAVSAMFGSGWLFSSLTVGSIAGPAAIFSWIIGGILVLIIACTYAELSTTIPISGGSARFPQLTHGTFVSLLFGWISWLGIMTAPPIETQALIQYTAVFWPQLLNSHVGAGLSHLGLLLATVIMLIFSVINIYSIRWVSRLNNGLTIWKLGFAVVTIVVLLLCVFKGSNFHSVHHGGFTPHGWASVFVALSTGGVLFAFNGYKQAVELAGETSNPKRTLLIALIGSLVISTVIYVLLQVSFIGALPVDSLKNGWAHLHFHGDAGPLEGLLLLLGFGWLAGLMYVNALVSTGSAGLVYCSSSARILYAMSANRQLPKFLCFLSNNGMPVRAIIVNFIVGMALFFSFGSWQAMIAFISSVIAASYLTGPICCLALRCQHPELERPFQVPFVKLWCYVAFLVCTLMVYWTGWKVIAELGVLLIISLALFFLYRQFSPRAKEVYWHWETTIWVWPYFVGVALVSYFSTGTHNYLGFGYSVILLALLCVLCLFLAVKYRLRDHHAEDNLRRLQYEARTGHALETVTEH